MLGGTVSYAGRAAIELGATVGILTSGNPEDRGRVQASLPGARLRWVDSPESMVFRNTYFAGGRRVQHLLSKASPLSVEHLPDGWESAPIVHLGPLAGEVSVDFVDSIGAQCLVGVTPQGWLRRRRPDGLVVSRNWEGYSNVLDRADALVFSEEDVPNQRQASRYVNVGKTSCDYPGGSRSRRNKRRAGYASSGLPRPRGRPDRRGRRIRRGIFYGVAALEVPAGGRSIRRRGGRVSHREAGHRWTGLGSGG